MSGIISGEIRLAALAIALALAAAVACGGAPVGREAFRHDFNGEIYVFVEYEDELAVFAESGRPVSSKRNADAALRSYVWTRAFDDADMSGLAQAADNVGELDSDIANARSASNAVVEVLDELDGIGASIPLMGRVSAMDLVESAYPGVDALGGAMRGLDSRLNDWGADSENLSNAAASLQSLSHSQHLDADAVESAFKSADSAARGLADAIGEMESALDNAMDNVSRLERALRSASDTPVIGGGLESLADEIGGSAGGALSDLAANLSDLKGDLNSVSRNFGRGTSQAERRHRGYAARWTGDPPDARWPPSNRARRSPPRPDPTPRPLAGGESTSAPDGVAPSATAPVRRSPPRPEPTPPALAGGESASASAGSAPSAPDAQAPAPLSATDSRREGRIAFNSGNPSEIYTINADGSGLTRLTDNSAGDWLPDWSPDGRKIAFASNRDGGNEIYAMNADGSGVARLTNTSGGGSGSPSWSPDGRKIAFVSDRNGSSEIYVMDADGSNIARVTNNSINEGKPSWSRDGRRLTFDAYPQGLIYAADADGSNFESIRSGWNPAFSPANNSLIAFGVGGLGGIHVTNADGSNVARLTSHGGGAAWSPDGRSVSFTSRRDGNENICVADADGSNAACLTSHSAKDEYPSWGPAP